MQPVHGGEIDLPVLLMGRRHRFDLRGDVALDDAVGVRDPAIGAFAGRDVDDLLRCRLQRGLGLCQAG